MPIELNAILLILRIPMELENISCSNIDWCGFSRENYLESGSYFCTRGTWKVSVRKKIWNYVFEVNKSSVARLTASLHYERE